MEVKKKHWASKENRNYKGTGVLTIKRFNITIPKYGSVYFSVVWRGLKGQK